MDYAILMEERVSADRSSQSVIKFQAGSTITDEFYFFSGLWFRDKLPIIYEDNGRGDISNYSEYINFIDLYGGVEYSFSSWLASYTFYEQYYDRTADNLDFFITFGLSGTLYDDTNQNVSYFSELYLARDSNVNADAFGVFGSESALKYRYKVYDQQAVLYLQAVWNTDAAYTNQAQLFDGYYSTRFGIQLNF